MLLLVSVWLSFASYHVKILDCNTILISIGPMGSIIQCICTSSTGTHAPQSHSVSMPVTRPTEQIEEKEKEKNVEWSYQ